jgi:hypothetical protein
MSTGSYSPSAPIVIELSAPQSIVSSNASLSETQPVIISDSSDSTASFVSLGFPDSLSFIEPDSEPTSSWRRFDDFSQSPSPLRNDESSSRVFVSHTIVFASSQSSAPSDFAIDTETASEFYSVSNGWRAMIATTAPRSQSDPSLSATKPFASPLLSTVKLRSQSSRFTPSASLENLGQFVPPGGTGSGGTLGLVLGSIFGILALIALIIAIWFLVGRHRSDEGEPAEPDVEFDTETDLGDTEFETQDEEVHSEYQSQDLDQMIADEFAFSAVFTDENEEESGLTEVFQMQV